MLSRVRPAALKAQALSLARSLSSGKKKSSLGFLSDWKYAAPLGLAVAIPALANEVVVLSAETQLLACFMLFCGTMYNQVGGMIAKSIDDYREGLLKEQRAVEDAQIETLQQTIVETEKCVSLTEDAQAFFAVQDETRKLKLEAANYEAKHALRASTVRKLEAVAAVEESALGGIRGRTINFVTDDVFKHFEDKKIKEDALQQAINVLTDPSHKIGKDIVGAVFIQSLKKYKTEYAKTPADSDPILVQLKKDVDAILKA